MSDSNLFKFKFGDVVGLDGQTGRVVHARFRKPLPHYLVIDGNGEVWDRAERELTESDRLTPPSFSS